MLHPVGWHTFTGVLTDVVSWCSSKSLGLLDPEDKETTFLRNVGNNLPVYPALTSQKIWIFVICHTRIMSKETAEKHESHSQQSEFRHSKRWLFNMKTPKLFTANYMFPFVSHDAIITHITSHLVRITRKPQVKSYQLELSKTGCQINKPPYRDKQLHYHTCSNSLRRETSNIS